MHWLRLLAGVVQTRLSDRYKVSHLSLRDTPRTCCSRIHVSVEDPTSNQNVSCFRKHDRRSRWKYGGNLWEQEGEAV